MEQAAMNHMYGWKGRVHKSYLVFQQAKRECTRVCSLALSPAASLSDNNNNSNTNNNNNNNNNVKVYECNHNADKALALALMEANERIVGATCEAYGKAICQSFRSYQLLREGEATATTTATTTTTTTATPSENNENEHDDDDDDIPAADADVDLNDEDADADDVRMGPRDHENEQELEQEDEREDDPRGPAAAVDLVEPEPVVVDEMVEDIVRGNLCFLTQWRSIVNDAHREASKTYHLELEAEPEAEPEATSQSQSQSQSQQTFGDDAGNGPRAIAAAETSIRAWNTHRERIVATATASTATSSSSSSSTTTATATTEDLAIPATATDETKSGEDGDDEDESDSDSDGESESDSESEDTHESDSENEDEDDSDSDSDSDSDFDSDRDNVGGDDNDSNNNNDNNNEDIIDVLGGAGADDADPRSLEKLVRLGMRFDEHAHRLFAMGSCVSAGRVLVSSLRVAKHLRNIEVVAQEAGATCLVGLTRSAMVRQQQQQQQQQQQLLLQGHNNHDANNEPFCGTTAIADEWHRTVDAIQVDALYRWYRWHQGTLAGATATVPTAKKTRTATVTTRTK